MFITRPAFNYEPTGDPSMKGTIYDCVRMVPTENGMEVGPEMATWVGTAPTGANPNSLQELILPNGGSRIFIGADSAIWELNTALSYITVVTNITSAYSSVSIWCFAQYGDISLAAAYGNNMAKSISPTIGTWFTPITSSPKASIVEVVDKFVFAADYIDASTGSEFRDGLFCASLGTYDSWIPSISTQCARWTLTSTPGRITAVRKFGSQIFVGKADGCMIGTYVGGNLIWDFQDIAASDGPISQAATLFIGTPDLPVLFFIGYNDLYVFDGSRPKPIGRQVRNYFYSNVDLTYIHKTRCMHDPVNKLVYVYFVPKGQTYCTQCLVYHYPTDRWGRMDDSIICCATINKVPVVEKYSDKKFYKLNGPAVNGQMSVVLGSNDESLLVQTVRPKWITKPQSAYMLFSASEYLGATVSNVGSSVTMANGRFDKISDANWHTLQLSIWPGTTQQAELNQLSIEGVKRGT